MVARRWGWAVAPRGAPVRIASPHDLIAQVLMLVYNNEVVGSSGLRAGGPAKYGLSEETLMAGKYPYVQSPGAIQKMFAQMRRAVPNTINAGTLKKLNIAPNNESYVLNTLRFLGFLGDDEKIT